MSGIWQLPLSLRMTLMDGRAGGQQVKITSNVEYDQGLWN